MRRRIFTVIENQRQKLQSRAGATAVLLLSMTLAACGGSDDETTSAVAERQAAIVANKQPVNSGGQYDQFNLQALPETAETDRFIVKYKEDSRLRRDAASVDARVNERTRSMRMHARHSLRLATGADVIVTDRKLTREQAKSYMQQIHTDPEVEYIEPDVRIFPQMAPNDPGYSRQFGYWGSQRSAGGINAEEAWDIANGAGITIAELDTGIAFHGDLDGNILAGTEISRGRFSGDGRDRGVTTESCQPNWHGTHVAGTLAASTNNGAGVAGTAWGAKIVPVKVLPTCGYGYLSDTATGVIWASGGVVPGAPANQLPAQVLNLSLGGVGVCSRTMQDAIDSALSRGTIAVVAAGNAGADAMSQTPANCNDVITVAAHKSDGAVASFSNWGNRIDISAPGQNVYSTWKSGRDASATDSYATMDGTSMATPHVAGVVALMQSVAAPRRLTVNEVKNIFRSTARPFAVQPHNPQGPGILDARMAVLVARDAGASQSGVLSINQSACSPSGKVCLVMQGDGNLVLYPSTGGQALWATGTQGTGATRAVMQADGNLALYTAANKAVWSTQTNNPGTFLAVQDDGNVVAYWPRPIWHSQTSDLASATGENAVIFGPGTQLTVGQCYAVGAFCLVFQADGNLVLYKNRANAVWNSGTYGRGAVRAILQPDGNLVIYNSSGVALWATHTAGNPNAYLALQADGNLVMYSNTPVWSRMTGSMSPGPAAQPLPRPARCYDIGQCNSSTISPYASR
ncbi:S8 family serine peptidase [Burkholderia sola]|uniref:S8 family serine peptidase n=1 Tax=Burkholderia TaxID=32008 RepID=UPI001AE6801F|nr:S8 family serine peptidase [Burkholderia sp. AcTa6-5]MBP0715989.1 S8 family serine peptidase [Burkholderia sp. AcTa6-5]